MLVFVTMIQAGMILFFFMGTTMAWLSSPLTRTKISAISRFLQAPTDHNGFSTWTESDDWSILSMENERNSSPDSESLYNQDLAWNTARDFEAITQGDVIVSQEDAWIGSIVDEIHNSFATLEEDHPPLYDSSFDEAATMTNAIDAMGNEIALLVRCNQHPEDLLIAEGRALPPLTDAERNDVSQLVRIDGEIIHATEFLKESISRIFHQHATANPVDGALCLDRIGVASWMTKSLKTEEGRVSAHDSRVLKTLSDFSSYGSGRLLEENLEDLYLTTIVGKKANERVSLKRHLALRQPYVDAVWRDIRNHGILAPVEQERNRLKEAITVKSATSSSVSQTIMDECEILDWNYLENDVGGNSADRKTATKSKSSHKLVEMAPNTKTPLWMRDGDFGKSQVNLDSLLNFRASYFV